MKKALILIDSDKGLKALIRKTSLFKPELMKVLYFGQHSPSVTVEKINQCMAHLGLMGNVARTGISGLIVGNTAEKILSRLSVDALIVQR